MRHSIFSRLGVLATVLAVCLGFSLAASAQSTTRKSYNLSLTVKSATVKSFTDEFTRKTGVLFSYESDLAQRQMRPRMRPLHRFWTMFSEGRFPDSITR